MMTASVLAISILASMEAYIQDVPPLEHCPGTAAYEAGQEAAKEYAPRREAIFGGMTFVGLLTSMAPEGSMPDPRLLMQVEPADQECYAAGYMKRSITNERKNALIGAALSAALWGGMALLAGGGS